MKPNKCLTCPHKETSHMKRICKITGKPVPLFSEPVDCPLKED